jgi:hypothetical protein
MGIEKVMKLKRYEIASKLGMQYFKDNLSNTNSLSSALVQHLDFSSGNFFTFLPDETDLKKVHEFPQGGIACGVRDQMAELILSKLEAETNLACIFDDVSATFRQGYQDSLFDTCGLTHKDEIYYVIHKNMKTSSLIEKCLIASNGIWHSLCVLFKTLSIDETQKNLSLKEIETIAKNTSIAIVGAYDGEGYIFWEK